MMFLLSACADFPVLDATISDATRQAPYPTLEPVPQSPQVTQFNDGALAARIAALQARAERLRQINISALQ